MGCFLACFGLSKKRRRPKTLYKDIAADQKHRNYEALDSSLTVNLAITENPIVPYSEFRDRDECKEEQTSVKTRKKVSFNLTVQIYEPNPTAYQILNNEEEESEKNSGETEGSAASTVTYPSSYRYYNCRDGFDEEDEIAYEESDIDAYDDDEFDDGDDWDDADSDGSEDNNKVAAYNQNIRQKELSEPFYSLVAEDRIKNQLPLAPNDTELKSNLSGRDRSIYMHSVMKPVENITQWEAIKAEVTSSKHRRKENVPLEQKTSKLLVSETSLNF